MTDQAEASAAGRPIVQFSAAPGVIDLGWGHPDPSLLPVELLRDATDLVARNRGADLLAYGAPHGPAPFIEAVAVHLGTVDAVAPDPDSIVATAGASHALDLLATMLSRPGDVVLVESPTYHIARKLLVDHGLEPVPIPRSTSGLDLPALETTIDALRRSGRRIAMLYAIPTFHNPTGGLLTLAQREALVELAERHELLIVEDDAYRELWYDGPPPASLRSLARAGQVIQVGSLSKTLAPGLRLGFVVGWPALAARLADSGLLDSGGGIAHFPALIAAELMASGAYAAHVASLRHAYRARRDALVQALAREAPTQLEVPTPSGGFFAWARVASSGAEARSARDLLPVAEQHGVSFVPGPSFAPDGGEDSSLRLSFSRYDPTQLAEAARRLALALRWEA